MIHVEKLKVAVWEADRHTHVLCMAQQDWERRSTPTSLEEIERDPEWVRLTDQILFRFAKLQDAMGQRLNPATLAALREPCEEWPMQDRLNRLEKLGFIEVELWLEWREIRNRLAHEYPDDGTLRFANMEAAIKASKALAENYRQWRTQLVQRNLLEPTLPACI